MKMNRLATWTILFCVMSAFVPKEDKVNIFLIGDSTMADKRVEAFPETGWGMPFRYFFDSTVAVHNHAKNGRSTNSFIRENLWSAVNGKLKTGDYVFIQFGHNDEAKEKTERYTTPVEYKANLEGFVRDCRRKNAIPVLLTPVTRRKFAEGKVTETHLGYSEIVRRVAAETRTPLIDLDRKSQQLLQRFGEEQSRLLFLHLYPGEHPNYPEGKTDNTHFSELGARLVAQLVLEGIREQHLDLENKIVKPVQKK
jgi:lysophospholipase L1-like esterase